MAIQAGVWLDHQQAVVVLLTDDGQETKKILAGVEKPTGGRGSRNSFTPNDFVAEDTRERRAASQRQKYYDEVAASIRGSIAVLVLGPGEAKGEFVKRIKSKKSRTGTVELVTADKMTDRQLVARVSQHFANVADKTAPSKKASKKKAVNTAPGRHRKKSK